MRRANTGEATIYYQGNPKLATTATGIDVTGTVTADGLAVDAGAGFTGSISTANNTSNVSLAVTGNRSAGTASSGTDVFIGSAQARSAGRDVLQVINSTAKVASFDAGGDISFYEDTGTTPKLFWDASAESLGIGTTSPDANLDISSATTSTLRLSNSDNALTEGQITGQLEFYQADTSSQGTGLTGKIGMRSAPLTGGGYFGNAADMDFYVSAAPEGYASDNATLKAITIQGGSGNVGIGDSDPSQSLNIARASADATFRMDRTGTGASALLFTCANGETSISSTKGGQDLLLKTANIEAMRIDASGNLLVGTTTNDGQSIGAGSQDGIVLAGESQYIQRGDNANLWLSKPSGAANSEYIKFYSDSALVGSIGVGNSNDLTIGTADTGLVFQDNERISPWNPSTNSLRDDAIDFGDIDRRFKDLYLSGTVALTTADKASAANMFVSPSTDFLYLEHPANGMIFRNTSGAEAMRIDASGNLLVGVTSLTGAAGPRDTSTTAGLGVGLNDDGGVYSAAYQTSPFVSNRISTDGELFTFKKDGTTVGSIGSSNSSSVTYLAGSASGGGIGVANNSPAVFPARPAGVIDNTINLGSGFYRFKDLYLSGDVITGGGGTSNTGEIQFVADSTRARIVGGYDSGGGGYLSFRTDTAGGSDIERVVIGNDGVLEAKYGVYLGGTGAANKLDDYEEGTWTPVIREANGAGTILVLSFSTGSYTKIGNTVTITGYVVRNDATSLTGALVISNLPFTQAGGPQTGGSIWVDNASSDVLGLAYANNGSICYWRSITNPNEYIPLDDFHNSRSLYFSRTYMTT